MPIYEYVCLNCGDKFELMRGFSQEDDGIKCPKCGAEKPRKVISLFASGSNSSESCAPMPSGGG